jgi:5-methylcytosine-specific restriction endonuclease McrA
MATRYRRNHLRQSRKLAFNSPVVAGVTVAPTWHDVSGDMPGCDLCKVISVWGRQLADVKFSESNASGCAVVSGVVAAVIPHSQPSLVALIVNIVAAAVIIAVGAWSVKRGRAASAANRRQVGDYRLGPGRPRPGLGTNVPPGSAMQTGLPTAAPLGEYNPRVIPQDVRIAVAARDGGKCRKCGSAEDLQYDHVIPWSRGGANTVNNVQLLCGRCNRRKGARLLPEKMCRLRTVRGPIPERGTPRLGVAPDPQVPHVRRLRLGALARHPSDRYETRPPLMSVVAMGRVLPPVRPPDLIHP